MENTTTPRPKLLTTKEAADYLGVSENSLVTWRSTKAVMIRFIKVGRHAVRYRQSDLDAFIENHVREG